MLEIAGLEAGYGRIPVLRGVALDVREGEMVALIGPNGAGKTTLLAAISGVVRPGAGAIRFEGRDIAGTAPHRVARLGLLHVPEGRRILADLSVLENLQLGLVARGARAPSYELDRIYDLFPILSERRRQRAGSLSGGQQQMLAIGRALMGAPRLLLLDEPSLGLAPLVVKGVFAALERLNAEGLTILLVEQNARQALAVTRRAYVVEGGRIVQEGTSASLAEDPGIVAHYLGGEGTGIPVEEPA